MNTLVPAGLISYPTVSGQRYRLYGVARAVPNDIDVQNALIAVGFLSLTYYTDPGTLPTDWPSAAAVPLSSDERAFYADGTWSISGQLPTSITVGSGALLVFDVWSYTADSNANIQNTSLMTSSSSSSTSTGTYVAVGALVIAAGFAATLMLLPKAHANPLGTSRTYVEQYGPTKIYLIFNAPTRTWRATVMTIPGYFEAAGYDVAYNKMVAYLKTLPDSAAAKGNPIDHYEVRVGSSVKLETNDFREAHASYSHWVKDAERRNGRSQEVKLMGNGKVLASFSLHGAKENPIGQETVIRACRSGSDQRFNAASGGSLGPGFYFTTDAVRARKYAGLDGCIVWVDVHMKNPFVGDKSTIAEQLGLQYHIDEDSGAYDSSIGRQLNEAIRRMGCDGIVATGRRSKYVEIVVFDNKSFRAVGDRDCAPKALPNPIHYSTSFTYRDVRIHVHEIDQDKDGVKYCADYRSIEQFVRGTGGQVCARKQSEAVTTAKRKVDAILERAMRYTTPERAPILSPWD